MLLTWLRSARFPSLRLARSRTRRRVLRSPAPIPIERLEDRTLLCFVFAFNDSYTAQTATQLQQSAPGVLSNDMGGSLSAVLVNDVTHGSLTLNSDGSFTYTSDAGFTGDDTFTYYATDGTCNSSNATVTITVQSGSGSNTAPWASDDAYTVNYDSLNTATAGLSGVLANDSDADQDPLTAVLVNDVAHGSLTLNSDGSFVYTPDLGYAGSDSFTYRADDGTDQSISATVTLAVAKPFGAQMNLPDRPAAPTASFGPLAASLHTGEVEVSHPVAPGTALVFDSLTDPQPVVAVETNFDTMAPVPDEIEVTFTLGGLAAADVFYDTQGMSPGSIRFPMTIDAGALPTGRYAYDLRIISHYGTNTATRIFTGDYDLVNRIASPIGRGWAVSGVDHLVTDTGGLLYVRSDGTAAWFTDNGDDTFTSPPGPLTTTALVRNLDGTYTLTGKYGNRAEFDADGLLTARVDFNGNTTAYTYTDADGDQLAEEISEITDPFSRTTTFTYTNGLLSSVEDLAGRTTTVAHDGSGRLTSITRPDPDGAAPLAAPVTTYGYSTADRLTSITDPLQRQTTLAYDFAGRLEQVTYPDASTRGFVAYQARGLVDTGSGEGTQLNPAALLYTNEATATATDGEGQSTSFRTDRFGFITRQTDPLGNITEFQRDAHGRVTRRTDPDPDGGGPLTAPVTEYDYDASGNLLEITFPDAATRTWTYHATLHRPLSATDELNKTTTYTYDSVGNRLTEADPLSRTVTYTYNARGQATSVTRPDPDGAGPLAAPVTTTAYDTSGRVSQITLPDSTTQQFTWDSADNLLTQTDELSRTTTYTWDNLDRLLTVTEPDPDGAGALLAPVWVYVYNAVGRITQIDDPDGNVTLYTWDDRDRLTDVTLPDPDGAGPLTAATLGYTYDDRGLMETETDPLGQVTTYGYNNAGWLTSVTLPDPDGAGSQSAPVTTYVYDNLQRVISVTDALSNGTTYQYDARNRLTRIKDALLGETDFTYDDAGRLAAQTDALDRTTAFTYDDVGNRLTITGPDPDGAGALTAPVTTFAYDALNRTTSATDPLGRVTAFAYDVRDRLTSRTDPDPDGAGAQTSPVTAWTYDAADRMLTVTDPLGAVTSYAYDHLGRLTSTTLPDPDGAGALTAPVFSRTYDALGNLLTETDPLGYVTTFAYDDLSRLTSRTDPDPDGAGGLSSPVTSWTYDAAGQLLTTTDPLGETTSYAYDALGRLTSTTLPDPDGAGAQTAPVSSTTYDAVGNVLTRTDPLNKTTTYVYDDLDRLTSLTDPLSGVTEYAYDAAGNLTSLTDPENNVTTFAYDGLDRLTSETNALSDVRSYAYDAVGNLTELTDRRGLVREFDYDGLDRRTEERWLDGQIVVETVTWTYDAAGRMLTADDADSTYAYTYDALGRVTSVDNTGTAGVPDVVLTSSYDALSRRTAAAASVDATDDFQNSYTYDGLSRLTRVEQAAQTGGNAVAAKRVDLAYTAAGRFATITRYADLAGTALVAETAYVYDDAGRLTDLTHAQDTTTLADYDWTYDAAGRITSFTSPDGTSAYTYDDSGQLTAADHSYQTDESYTYDDAGNRTNTGYSTGTNNRLLSDGTSNYEYDAEGNRTKKAAITSLTPGTTATGSRGWNSALPAAS